MRTTNNGRRGGLLVDSWDGKEKREKKEGKLCLLGDNWAKYLVSRQITKAVSL